MSKVIVKAVLKCKKCNKEAEYSSDQREFDFVICIHCGAKIKVVVYADQIDTDYTKTKTGQIVRKQPKVKMSKKERRRYRKELIK